VVGKFNKLVQLIKLESPDVISLNETRTNKTTEAYIYELCRLGYYPIIKSRKQEYNRKRDRGKFVNGGGVALMIKDNLMAREVKEKDLTDFLKDIEAVVNGVFNTKFDYMVRYFLER
jgi:hypothetical protein